MVLGDPAFGLKGSVGWSRRSLLDAGRFRWSVVPWRDCLLGYALLLVGIGIAVRAEAVNGFFEWGVRIQAERGYRVIDTGPYAMVRHPGYVGNQRV